MDRVLATAMFYPKIKSFESVELLLKPSILSLSASQSYSLERIKRLMKKLGDPQNKLRVIHVAGTSGKTSTAYFITEMLRQNGYKTGLSASPHIDNINERLQIDLLPLPEKQFCRELSDFLKILERTTIKPTYFELFTAFAFWYFAKIKVDCVVMETGLGGLLDATNVVENPDKICVITDIGLDHTDILGKTLIEIAKQKAGIIQTNNVVLMNQQPNEIMRVFQTTANGKKARLKVAGKTISSVDLPLIQKRNFGLAEAAAKHIFEQDNKKPLDEKSLRHASSIIIPGRMEKHKFGGKDIILDGAHNAQKMRALVESLTDEIVDRKFCVVLAVGTNKKQHLLQISRLISTIASDIILTTFDASQDYPQKSLDPNYVGEYFPGQNVQKTFDAESALRLALRSSAQTVLITGSLYLMAPMRELLGDY